MVILQKFARKNPSWFIPLLLTLIVYIPLLFWLSRDNALPSGETGSHLFNSLQYGRLWYDFIAGKSSLWHLLSAYHHYPPFFYQPAVLFYSLFGVWPKVAVASQLIWIYVFMYSGYHLSRLISQKKNLAVLIFIFVSIPLLFVISRSYQPGLAILAWAGLFYLLAHRSVDSPKPSKCYWMGAVAGLGMLLNWTFILLILPGIIWSLVRLIRNRSVEQQGVKKIITSAVLAVAIASSWYLPNWSNVSSELTNSAAKSYDFHVAPFIPARELCPINHIVLSVPQGASARLVGSNPGALNDQTLGYYLEKAGRRWSGGNADVMDSDYWVLRLDGSMESKVTLFRYQDIARIVTNLNCSDRTLVVVMKNATRAETYLPVY